jgi:hypothetical protein
MKDEGGRMKERADVDLTVTGRDFSSSNGSVSPI